jgi:YidC/Oxa1 family membrane protein insertase
MDKNTVIGLGLIGVILATFTYLNKPTEEELKAQKAKQEIALQQEKKELDKEAKKIYNTKESSPNVANSKTEKANQSAEIFRLQSNKLVVDLNTRGGIISSVFLKGYKTYHQFANKSKQNLQLVDNENSKNVLKFKLNGKEYSTENEIFTIVSKTKKSVVLETEPIKNKKIQYIYSLSPDGFDLDFEVKFVGFTNEINSNDVVLNWEASLPKTERLLSEQRRVSTICFKYKGEEYDYLSEVSDDEEELEKNTEWVAFKQSYFSTIMKPIQGFDPDQSQIKIVNYKEGHPKFHTHIKKYIASMNLGFSNPSNGYAKINWFFGPNDYEILKSYDSNYEDIINYGWGLFRWINIYAIQPMFNAFAEMGIGLGIVILLITIILKLFLTPIQWKMYVSSAKMKILKPEIDELNAKYPNKEDAMKKQMDMMALYKESGASPLAGCIPMLIQMPILLAIFRFFPAAFELRQKPFLWAEDLSSYDSIYDFSYYLPFYGNHISLFTLLMAITTLVYTHINSGNMQQPQQPGMPNMKVIMYFFPVMMIFFFNNYSSGLSYYYFISTLISIIIMLAIKHFFVDEDKLKQKMNAKKMAATASPKKKSKFQERLEQMQKTQQERLKKK